MSRSSVSTGAPARSAVGCAVAVQRRSGELTTRPHAARRHRVGERERLPRAERAQLRLEPALVAAGEIPRRLAVPRDVHAHAAKPFGRAA